MTSKLRASIPWCYLCLLVLAGVYICHEAFLRESAGHFSSMHGEWIALARIVGLDWLGPRWWPYWGGGAPIQYAYAPLVPFLIAAASWLAHSTPAMALHAVTGLVYCLGPATLYFASWRLTRMPGYSFFAGLAYLAAFPAEHVDPASGFGLAWFVTTRRAYRVFEWDDLPHLLCLTVLPLAVWLLSRALAKRRPVDYFLGAVGFAVMMVASLFGVVLTVLVAITVALAYGGDRWQLTFSRAGVVAVAAYLLACPWAPPSLLLTVRRVAMSNGEADWSARGVLAFTIVVLATAGVWWIARRWIREWPVRWMALFACPMVLIPALDHYLKIHFLPQSYRYQTELEMMVCLAAVFLLRPAIERLPKPARAVLAAALVVLAIFQERSERKYQQWLMFPVDVARSVEFRSAKWFEANMPDGRVMQVGSMAAWMNAFVNVQQFGGQSYSTAPNPIQQAAHWAIMSAQGVAGEAPYSIRCLKAYGVQAVVVPGPKSPEYWKPFTNTHKFDGALPVLWSEDDTTVYRIPQATTSLAHAMRFDQVAPPQVSKGVDLNGIGKYLAALDDPPAPASFDWRGPNVADIHAALRPGDVVTVQVNYDSGWRAFANGSPRPIRRDGLGLMIVDAGCTGACEIRLEYDGGMEAKLCRVASAAVLLLFAAWFVILRRTSKSA